MPLVPANQADQSSLHGDYTSLRNPNLRDWSTSRTRSRDSRALLRLGSRQIRTDRFELYAPRLAEIRKSGWACDTYS